MHWTIKGILKFLDYTIYLYYFPFVKKGKNHQENMQIFISYFLYVKDETDNFCDYNFAHQSLMSNEFPVFNFFSY